MKNMSSYNQFHETLKEASDHILEVISKQINVNTFCVASNDRETSLIFSALHQDEHLFDAGTSLPFLDAY
ncbi:hypothetical protein JCM9140_836 [Halalkalibacter wakoensis JCM 9140]|uniref:Uncharacterized protein n=1 Tax=Halalkalibacter wakoensis JCM 9140 TaxID=1236970 RepID=W4Q0G3_9BACI|nr:hypothetical protein [Halalkalibacter wakoensis]GAE24874.1 hypothetical protein JCM9140_836 [Halalkalibacter wakoensis JCM 9140]